MVINLSEKIEQLVMSRSDTNMQHDLQLLDEKIRQIKQELQHCEERLSTIQNSLSAKSVNLPKVTIPVSVTTITITSITPTTIPATPSKGTTIPPFSLCDTSMLKHIFQEEVDQGNTFLTIYDFIEKFESTLAFYRVDLDASWLQYLAASVRKGGDQKIMKWFEQAFGLEPTLKMTYWKEIREKLTLRWDITLDLQKSRQQFISTKQANGEPAINISSFHECMEKSNDTRWSYTRSFLHSIHSGSSKDAHQVLSLRGSSRTRLS